MAFDDLDLEFEDEEEAKKKKNDAVQVDVDLEFAVGDSTGAPKKPAAVKTATSPPHGAAPPGEAKTAAPVKPAATVTKIDEARKAPAGAPRPATPAAARPATAAPKVSGSSALQAEPSEFDSQQVVEMREHVRQVEFDAAVKVAVAEFKTELLSELLSDTKLMQHQVEQLLVRINAKHPDMKNEVLMIKKLLADFAAKKRN